jgi:predicted DNA-binding ribbon-helix-helix protein
VHRPRQAERETLPTLLVPRNVSVSGVRTTVRLEPIIWETLQDIAHAQEISVHDLVTDIDQQRITKNLSAEIRAYVDGYLLGRVA